ncbi:MAG: glutamate--tRNA ligase [Nitrosomonadaceae bacterium]|nr:glutamate--tRNA ligase [Nitrosomonadaceae bacterium]
MIRTRFAPSPTGYLHIGGARTALFSWAYARRHGGQFILRIEDTDLERSTNKSTQAILESMAWLGIDYDEGPFYQMQRLARYHDVAEQLLRSGDAYYCYATKEELTILREQQRAAGLKPKYDGRWRDSKKIPPAGIKPVIRFKNPKSGSVAFNDLVKGPIIIDNSELDDLVLLRADGVPTYNFGVVIDDLDMKISHVIRGDDHINNTPRQINILKALNEPLPQYAHVPTILGTDGERLSKRHGAISVMQYSDEGYLPEALINYLVRLGWSHGDEEIFNRDQFINWFNLTTINRSPARFDSEKLRWINHHYLKEADNTFLANKIKPLLEKQGCDFSVGPDLKKAVNIIKERAATITELADKSLCFFTRIEPSVEIKEQYYSADIRPILENLITKFSIISWDRKTIHDEIKKSATAHNIKFPKIAMPLRIMVTGKTQTPSIDLVLEILGSKESIERMNKQMDNFPTLS